MSGAGAAQGRIARTLAYFNAAFLTDAYFSEHPDERRYRMEHSLRVAHIGRQIAQAEGLDAEALTVACLLHDVGYTQSTPDWTEEDAKNHARYSARIVRPFVESLGFPKALSDEMLYGIAIHCDGKADFSGEATPLAMSVSDADNIDRFDAYRIYDNLLRARFDALPLAEQLAYCAKRVERLPAFAEHLKRRGEPGYPMPEALRCGTETGARMWLERIEFTAAFHQRLLSQLQTTVLPAE